MPARIPVLALAALASSAMAFTPSSHGVSRRSAVRVASSEEASVPVEAAEPAVEAVPPSPPPPVVAKINGWAPDSSLPCYGLPGAIAPFGYFDPLGFCKDKELGEVKRIREAEVREPTHRRLPGAAILNAYFSLTFNLL